MLLSNKFSNIYGKNLNVYLFWAMFAYFGIYLGFLHYSEYLPYVLDGNETYSSLVHAYNMYFGDWSKSFGLTDEAFSPFPEAHPMIHTHQGNWPRIYAFILFALGARTAESQIILHVFTIGALSIWLMHRFFAKITSNMFALIISLIFMTDYILFAQWQVVTYRVWHCFFIFAIFNCMHEFESSKKWKAFFIFNFAALYYWELVFAFYLSVWSLLYYWTISKSFKKTFKCGLLISASGLSAIAILFTQLSLFMGPKNVIEDFSLTFFARNFAKTPDELIKVLKGFYETKNIAVFYNVPDSLQFKGLINYITSFFKYGFQMHTPVLSLMALIVLCSIILRFIKDKTSIIGLLQFKIPFRFAVVITTFSWLILLTFLAYDNAFLGIKTNFYIMQSVDLVFAVVPLAILLAYLSIAPTFSSQKSIQLNSLILINSILIISSYLIRVLPNFYSHEDSVIWYDTLTKNLSIEFWWVSFVLVQLFAVMNISLSKSFNEKYINSYLTLSYLMTAIAAYSLIYILSPGYLHSGYLQRTAPFSVFFLDLITGLLFCFLITYAIFIFKLCKARAFLLKGALHRLWYSNIVIYCSQAILLVVSMAILVAFVYQWFAMQNIYTKLFPPTSFVFVKQLRTAEFQKKSIVTDQYSLPFAYETHSWGYSSGNVGIGPLLLGQNDNVPEFDRTYLWYADRKENLNYKNPDYFICFSPNSFGAARNKLHGLSKQRFCSATSVVGFVDSRLNINDATHLKHSVVSRDTADRWTIVKYNWNLPLYNDTQPN